MKCVQLLIISLVAIETAHGDPIPYFKPSMIQQSYLQEIRDYLAGGKMTRVMDNSAKTGSVNEIDMQGTYTAVRIYAENGLSIFEPVLPNGYFMLGHHAQGNHGNTADDSMPIVRPLYNGAIAHPDSFRQVYTNAGTNGDQDISFWHAIPPSDYYVCLGTVASLTHSSPPDEALRTKYACVWKDLVQQVSFSSEIWNDQESGDGGDGTGVSLWNVERASYGKTGYFVAQSGYNEPPLEMARALVES